MGMTRTATLAVAAFIVTACAPTSAETTTTLDATTTTAREVAATTAPDSDDVSAASVTHDPLAHVVAPAGMTETLRETEQRQLPVLNPTGESADDETITFDRTVLLFEDDPAAPSAEAAQADGPARTLEITWRTLATGTTLEDHRATLFDDQMRIESLRSAGYTREVVTFAHGTDAELLHHPPTDEHVMAWWTPEGGAHISAVGLTRATVLEVAATVDGGSPPDVENPAFP